MSPEKYITADQTPPHKRLFEPVHLEAGVEPTGANQTRREDSIRSAKEFRTEYINETMARIKSYATRWSYKPAEDRKRLAKTERRRQNYVETYEERAREWIAELLLRLDPDDENDQAFITQELKQIYLDLKYRLLIVEMETRRLAFTIFGEATGIKETREERKWRVVSGREAELDIAELVLAEIDGYRREEGLPDDAIRRRLMQEYHPDVSQFENAEDITVLIDGLYDPKTQRFLI